MVFAEKELEDFIFSFLNGIDSCLELQKRGLHEIIPQAYYVRQLNISGYGIADIVGFDLTMNEKVGFSGTIQVFELKKEEISEETFLQSIGYIRGLQRILNDRLQNVDFQIILIGSKIKENSNFVFLPNIFYNVWLYVADFNPLKGIELHDKSDYYSTKESKDGKISEIAELAVIKRQELINSFNETE